MHLLSYEIYIHNTVAHKIMKWNSHVFDIVLHVTVCNPNIVFNE